MTRTPGSAWRRSVAAVAMTSILSCAPLDAPPPQADGPPASMEPQPTETEASVTIPSEPGPSSADAQLPSLDAGAANDDAGHPSVDAGAVAVAGPQHLYRLVLTRTTSLGALVLNRGADAHRVSLLSGTSLSSCLRSDSRLVAATPSAGTCYLAFNARSAGGGAEYNLSVTECAPGDPGC